MTATGEPATPVRLGVSSCLLGQRVRYDGRDKHEPYLTDVLGDRVRWLSVCPELDIGLGVPREPIHLLAGPGEVRLVGVDTGDEHTVAMRGYAERRVDELERAGLDGYVLKARSPSCGLEGVPVHDPVAGEIVGHDRGRFAAVLVERIRDLPVVEEDQLAIPDVRDRFLERVCVRHRWRRLGDPPSPDGIAELHARHEMQVLAHSPDAHRDLTPLAAAAGAGDLRALRSYRTRLHAALERPTTRDRHVAVLRRLAGSLDDGTVRGALEGYAGGDVAWADVVSRVRDAASSAGMRLASQTYLDPLAEVGRAPETW